MVLLKLEFHFPHATAHHVPKQNVGSVSNSTHPTPINEPRYVSLKLAIVIEVRNKILYHIRDGVLWPWSWQRLGRTT
jgi:hypothetical protein